MVGAAAGFVDLYAALVFVRYPAAAVSRREDVLG